MDALGRIIAACKEAGITPRDIYAPLPRIFEAGRKARLWRTRDEFTRDVEEVVCARAGVEYRGQRYLIGVSLARRPSRDNFRLFLSSGPMWCWALRFIPES